MQIIKAANVIMITSCKQCGNEIITGDEIYVNTRGDPIHEDCLFDEITENPGEYGLEKTYFGMGSMPEPYLEDR